MIAQHCLDELKSHLSPNASITFDKSATQRWSDFDAPQPGAIVNVATEKDVETTVRICNSHSIPLLAQSGGHGWGLPNTLQSTGVLINLRGLNRVSFSDDRTRAIVQGGTLVKELIDAAWEHDVHVVTGLCNTVGVLGAALGGGYGAMIGLHGLGVDNFLAMNVVLADGSAVEVTPEKEPDLWWAMRGAGSSFAIVVSCVVKAYPVPREENKAWSGALTFSGDKLEEIVKVMQELELPDNALNFFYLVTSGPPDFTPCVMVTPWYYGTSEEEARKFFKPIFDIGPLAEQVAMIPYPEWNSPSDPFCVKGGRKPGYGIVSSKMEPKVWREIWNNFVEFVQNPGTGGSVVLVEGYPHRKINSFPVESSSFPWRKGRFNCITIPIYHDPTLDEKAEEFGRTVRETLRKVEGSDLKVYVNFSRGDEPVSAIYGPYTERLIKLKRKYDPKNVFGHFLRS